MTTIPYSTTPRYTNEIHDDDVFVIEEHGSGFQGMKKITVVDFLQPVYDKIYEQSSTVYKFMGSVDVYEHLPEYTGPQYPVPVYGVMYGTQGGKNFAWIDNAWQLFGVQVDLTSYVDEEELSNVLLNYTRSGHKHRQSDIEDLSVLQSLTLVQESPDDGGTNVFSVQKTDGSSQEFSIKNGRSGTDSVNYRMTGTGSVTRNANGSYSPEYLYLQSQKLTDIIAPYNGRILIASQNPSGEWITVYPQIPNAWRDESFLQFYIPPDTTVLRIRLYPSGTDYSEISDDKILYEEHVSVAQTGPAGASVKSVEIEADSYIFKANEIGEIQEPAEINFTVHLQNTVGSPSWSATNGPTLVKSGSGETFSVNAQEMGSYTSLVISVVCDGLSDTCTIMKISDGVDGTSPRHVICDNESFVIPTNADGVTQVRFETDVKFQGYSGTDEIQCTILNVTNVPHGMTFSIASDTLHLMSPVSTVFFSDFGSIRVFLQCDNSVISKYVSWSLSKGGFSAKSVSIEADSYVFKADSSGVIREPDQIEFRALVQNLTSVPIWSLKNGTTTMKTGNGNAFIVKASEMGSYTNAQVRVTCEGYSDSCSIVVLSDGLSGYSTAQVRLFKRQSEVPASYAGSALTYHFSTNAYEFGPGGSDGWSSDVPAGEDTLYVIYASAHSQLESDVINANEWTEPAVLSEEGTAGQNGYSTATVMIYARDSQTPTVPQDPVTYRFEGGQITGLPSNWSKNVPEGMQNLWMSQATAFSRSDSDVIESSEWSSPVIVSYNGRDPYNNAQLFLYKRDYSLPAAYSGGVVTYDFTNATFSFGTGGDDGWSPVPVTANGNIYVICFSASSQDNIIEVQPSQWTAPQLYVMEPRSGSDGYSSAAVSIYTRSAIQPHLPENDVTYVFDTGDITGLPSNWFKTPPEGILDLWMSQTNVVSNTGSVVIGSDRWASPIILASNGASGSDGWSSAQVLLFKRAMSLPARYAGTSVTYHFSTGEIDFAGTDDGWSPEPPADNGNLYVIIAMATSQTDTDVIAVNEWSDPVLYVAKAEDGQPGENGYNVATVLIYKRSENAPDLPEENVTYEFSTGEVRGLTGQWYSSVPNGTEQLWVSQATAFSRSTTDVIESSQWSVPSVMAKNGEDGTSGCTIVCDNESFVIPTDKDGKVVETFQTASSFFGYVGTEAKDVVLSSLSGVPLGMDAVINGNSVVMTIPQNIGVPSDYGVISLTVTCDGVGVSKFITWSKAKNGADGQPGEHGTNWYQGTILTGETVCRGFPGKVGDCYLNTDTCNVYYCETEGDAETAVWRFELNIKGEDGSSFTTVIESSNGSVIRLNEPFSITLSCRVYLNTDEVTDSMQDWRFRWTRTSGDPVDDERWNSQGKAIGHKQVEITNTDVLGRSVFNCEVDLTNL